ncbi:MAG TPA: UDP-N-acetylmuramate dehydrogenase [Spirochaetota bacterium]|nr:UDP-N-acetylmuramate dehydrogenase [Spirochaetota bacterium]HPC42068.1 UDP-N-acetylmuramate dehydrogenase [Spirochaetota bacterium]HPL15988.1 UDP-N-acetylmuramate dehydrogenase [Spirochaetota bacterium]HQF09022.1 UDP-N-acetylmuramate dehydrogenase [Spirochaetota bacterium]HQH97910.1 UDP-N-acetylmuramate dehydrogenase [Spirochaetota bacterium]
MNIPERVIDALREWGEVKESEPLRHYTTYKTGGPADALVLPRDNASVPRIVSLVRSEKLPLTVIGGGSNLLVSDRGIEGVVMRICEDGSRRPKMAVLEDGTVYADAMAGKESLIEFVIASGFGGIEFMAGIPGCIGGGIMMNAGTFMGSFAGVLMDVDIVDGRGSRRVVAIDSSMSSYRHMDIGDDVIITGARFRFPAADDPAGVRAKVEEILADRRNKHPLEYPSAGSVFKNPQGHSSWKLINDAGLKGKTVGGARVSDLHTNFIINAGNATSDDIRNLIDLVRETVYNKFGIRLEPEVKMLGLF